MEPTPDEISALLGAFNAGRIAEAEARAAAMTRAYPQTGVGWLALGVILAQQGRTQEALAPMERSAALFPHDPEAHNNLGAVLQRLGRFAEAEAHFRKAVTLKPDYAEAQNNLGAALQSQGRLGDAEAAFRQALALNSGYAEAHNNLGILLRETGRPAKAEDSFRRVLVLQPNDQKAHQNLIFTLGLTSADTASLQAECRRWADRFAPARGLATPFANSPAPDRRLRVGYVSADFRKHSAAAVFGTMLTAFDPEAFEVFAYSNATIEDEITAMFQRAIPQWRTIVGRSDDAAADLIRGDGIDILVDLSGHSAGNRLGVFAMKPAPIQITAWGYLTGTGMDAMDVIFSDPVLIPADEKRFYAEEVRYLPNAISAFFPRTLPAVKDLPALSQGAVTFGSFNRICKISEETLAVWGRVLQAVPGSRFLMKSGELDEPGARDRMLKNLSAAGIDAKRITLLGKTSWYDHLQAFNEIDIALDTFPHNGGVTTLEGLLAGVPAVTLRWPTIVGRLSATILTAAGLMDWIAETPDEYVQIAARKAADLRSLQDLRQGLRARLAASVIGDSKAYAAAVEREYKALWREWCGRHRGEAAQ